MTPDQYEQLRRLTNAANEAKSKMLGLGWERDRASGEAREKLEARHRDANDEYGRALAALHRFQESVK